ncbi:MAG: alpha-glucosidase C-terminal domain-containing protein [Bacteroidia bacterium]|nr:alpha-glucosidase C-terminal domain-containing protein [Bacteroidia bacterium]
MKYVFWLLVSSVLFSSCKQICHTKTNPKSQSEAMNHKGHEKWSKNAVIYEVNIRQFTKEGTFRAFESHLPRLKKMGVDILWLMPVQPLGLKNRKGSVGSHYSIKDYLNVNPDYGSMDDFKHLVKEAHAQGMYVIIDWVANHTAWDNPLIEKHKEWYTLNEKGEPKPPVDDWTDVADLNYDQPGLREYMIDALKFWVQQTHIDGYRCDVAEMVPTSFWTEARKALNTLDKPVFMLAEAENPELHPFEFDMNYTWEFHHTLNDIANGKKNVKDLDEYFTQKANRFPPDVYRMNFTSNHDENSWKGSEYERMHSAEAVRCMGVVAATVPGMLLIYNGQEDSLSRRLKFFDKDYIHWGHYPLSGYYQTLNDLKHKNHALWNGSYGGPLSRIHTDKDEAVFAFSRTKDNHSVVVMCNMSNTPQTFSLKTENLKGVMKEIFTKEDFNTEEVHVFTLNAWEYRVFSSI